MPAVAPAAVETSGRPCVSSSMRPGAPVAVAAMTARSAVATASRLAWRRACLTALKMPAVARRTATASGCSGGSDSTSDSTSQARPELLRIDRIHGRRVLALRLPTSASDFRGEEDWHEVPSAALGLSWAGVLVTTGALVAGPAPEAAASPDSGDFSGLVDIGGRSLYLQCSGEGSPTVILESGLDGRGDVWSRDNLRPAGERTMVQPGVARFTRVCAYDRPGTLGEVNPDLDPGGPEFYPSRSDPVPQPRTTRDLMDDLHSLLGAADIPGPYVLAAHSAGGLVARLYASTYPDEVAGMVLIDTTNENVWRDFETVLTPAQYAAFEAATLDDDELLAAYPEAERLFTAPLADTPERRPGASGPRGRAAASDADGRSGPRHSVRRAHCGLADRCDGGGHARRATRHRQPGSRLPSGGRRQKAGTTSTRTSPSW